MRYFLIFRGEIGSRNRFVLSDCMLWLDRRWSAWLSGTSGHSGCKYVLLEEGLADKFFQEPPEISAVGDLVPLAFKDETILFCFEKCGSCWIDFGRLIHGWSLMALKTLMGAG